MGVCIKGRFCVVRVGYRSPKQMYFFTCSSLHNWSAATGRWQHSKWRQSGDLYEQCVGHCMWWLLGKYWCHCGVSTTGLLNSRSGSEYFSVQAFKSLCSIKLGLICFLTTDAVAFSSAHFGAGTGTIYLDNVGCTGTESNLIDCTRSSTVSCSSGHSEDAGVRCQGKSESWINFDGKFLISLIFCVCSPFKCHLSLWWCSSGGRLQSVWGQSGGVHQWPVGNCVWWQLGHNWCYCGLQTAGICIYRKYELLE